jgi:glycosyltransferase involved in cell wall biosynthesis
MRIILDLQGAQAQNQRRGIGRYSLSLAQSIVRNNIEHEIIIALNGKFAESVTLIREAFHGMLPQQNIRVWEEHGPVSHAESDNDIRRKVAEITREAFLLELNPDVIHISSVFEGHSDDAVTSIGRLGTETPVVVTLYDLIPYIYRTPYLEDSRAERWYEEKLCHLRRASLVLAISESSRQEGLKYLELDSRVISNISTAAETQFRPIAIQSLEEDTLRLRYQLTQPFILYTGGIDHRKNIEGLIRSYARLPQALRTAHQLVIVCSIELPTRHRLEKLAEQNRLRPEELILTGYVPDEDLVSLYNLCKLFIFPSLHEGFGLPALEAMQCGAAVIGSNTSSLPEVVGLEEALFDPRSDDSICAKLLQALTDETFRTRLKAHGLEQASKFSWDQTGKRAIAAFEDLITAKSRAKPQAEAKPTAKPRLAFVSPLPPERTGIAEYSAELLPELSRFYDITVVVNQNEVVDPWIQANCAIQTPEWLTANTDRPERVIYHFGNSSFHQHMFALLEQVPGTVVLHDFFLSGIQAHREIHGIASNVWVNELYYAHGYKAVKDRFSAEDTADIVWRYPSNLNVLNQALGVIVHSKHSCELGRQWYGNGFTDNWSVIPLLRIPAEKNERTSARLAFGFGDDDFVVCSFGLLGPTKLNHLLLDAWLTSTLAEDPRSMLIFVGDHGSSDYGLRLLQRIRESGIGKRVRITGWVDNALFRKYLAASDVAVQLRALSRGETSAAVLDCMNYGLPTIANSNGSTADIPHDTVWMLPDKFERLELVEALERLSRDSSKCEELGVRAQSFISASHNPSICAKQYRDAIERFHLKSQRGMNALFAALGTLDSYLPDNAELAALAQCVAQTFPDKTPNRQIMLDISELVQRDAKSGIQRVTRSILIALLNSPPKGFKIEPVYATTQKGYRYARRFTLQFLECPLGAMNDDPVEFQNGDIFLGLDLQPQVVPENALFYQHLRNHGVVVQFVVYDLLCIAMPQFFVTGAAEGYRRWLNVVAQADGAICISKSVADELAEWLGENGPQRIRPFKISCLNLGADVENSVPSQGLPRNAGSVLEAIKSKLSFLMVGTIEPRKQHSQTLAAFELLWAQNVDINLVIVGKQGWMVEKFIRYLEQHSELSKRLIWLDGISDDYLKKVYAASSCLIAASEGEGFGLPLIEAAQHRLPIIARDIHVFREVASEHALYFNDSPSANLVETLKLWISLHSGGLHPRSELIKWFTWHESAEELKKILLCGASVCHQPPLH